MASTFRLDMTHIRCCQEAFESAVHILLQPRWSSKSESRLVAGSGGCLYSPKTDLKKSGIFRLTGYGLNCEFTLSAKSGSWSMCGQMPAQELKADIQFSRTIGSTRPDHDG